MSVTKGFLVAALSAAAVLAGAASCQRTLSPAASEGAGVAPLAPKLPAGRDAGPFPEVRLTSAELDAGVARPPVPGVSSEHERLAAEALARAKDQLAKNAETYRWETRGDSCDPRELVRPNRITELVEPPGLGGCPRGMAPVASSPTACIDRWEAHVVLVLEDGSEEAWSPFVNPGTLAVRAKSAPKAVPQAYISQVQAASACEAAGKRLCSEEEWTGACRGSARTAWPYGATERLGTCNDHRDQHPAVQYLKDGTTAVFDKIQHPCINQVASSLLPAGAKEQCVTPDGVYDLVGNVHEWTAGTTSGKGAFRGGYYMDTKNNGRGCDYVTSAHEPSYWDFSTGFRCCADRAGR